MTTTESATLPEPGSVPTPSGVSAKWFPVTVKLPDHEQPWPRAKIYAAPEGLYIYLSPPDDGVTPDWFSPIVPGQQKPTTGWRARNGVTIATEAGPVTLTASGACGCGSPLKRWVPEFERKLVVW